MLEHNTGSWDHSVTVHLKSGAGCSENLMKLGNPPLAKNLFIENIVTSRKLPVKKRAEIVDSEGTLHLSEDAKHCSLSLVMRSPSP